MLPSQNTQHVEEARKLLTEQFRGRTRIQGFLDCYIRPLQALETVFWDIINSRILDSAVGAQLDMLGTLVIEPRRGRTDEEYRLGIRIRIVVNKSRGRAADVLKVASLAATEGVSPVYDEYRYLNFSVQAPEQIGERYLVDYLAQARAASSYGTLVTSDLPEDELLMFDDVSHIEGIETFGDVDRTGVRPEGTAGCGKLAWAGYGLPQNLRRVVLVGDPDAYPAPRIDCVDVDDGNTILHGAFFAGATIVTIGGSPVAFEVLSDARISTPAPFDGEIDVTTEFGTGIYPFIDSPVLFSVDFSALSTGPSDFSGLGLTYQRYGSTRIQTAADTVYSSAGADTPTIGASNGTNKGLIVQPVRANYSSTSPGFDPRDMTSTGWNAGSGITSYTANAAAGPDGQVKADQISVAAGGYGNYFGPSAAPGLVYSAWFQNADCVMDGNSGDPNVPPGMSVIVPSSASWARHFFAIPSSDSTTKYFGPVDARNSAGTGGRAAQAVSNARIDMVQFEYGTAPGEPIDQDSGDRNRYPDVVTLPGANAYVDDGVVNFHIAFYPRIPSGTKPAWNTQVGGISSHGTSDYLYLFSVDASNYARIDAATGQLQVAAGGTTATAAVNVSFAADDLVDIHVKFGGGAGEASYSVNGGSTIDLSMSGTIADSFNASTAMHLFHNANGTTATVSGNTGVYTDAGFLFARIKLIEFLARDA